MPILRAVNITKTFWESPHVYPRYQANPVEGPHWLLKILLPFLHSVLGILEPDLYLCGSAMILSLDLFKGGQ